MEKYNKHLWQKFRGLNDNTIYIVSSAREIFIQALEAKAYDINRTKKAFDDYYTCLNSIDENERPKIEAILDAEICGYGWIENEVKSGTVYERFPKYYKAYIDIAEYITGKKLTKDRIL